MPNGRICSNLKLSKGGKNTVRGVLTTVLGVAESVVKGCPVWGPEAAISAVLVVLKGIDQTEQNIETLNDLKNHVQRLVEVVLTPILSVNPSDVPDGLKTDVDRLNYNLIRSVKGWDSRFSKGATRRFFSRDKDSNDLVSLEKNLKNAITTFQTTGTVRIQLSQKQAADDAKARDEAARERDAKLLLAQQQEAADARGRDKRHREETTRIEQSRLLSALPRAELASYDSGRSDTRPPCFKGTRAAVLKTIEEWFTNKADDAPRLFWLNGMAGIGKSTIAQSVATRAHELGVLGASFFFFRQDAKLGNSTLVFPELASQLAEYHPMLRPHVAKALENSPGLGAKALMEQFTKLFIDPLIKSGVPRGAVIILDALDECDARGATQILQLLLGHVARIPFPIFIFITSRPEPHIHDVLGPLGTKYILHDIEQSIVQGDIDLYIRSGLKNIPASLPLLRLKDDWVEEANIQALVKSSGNLFIYAATALRFIADKSVRNPSRQLHILLRLRSIPGVEAHFELDRLYVEILRDAMPNMKDEDNCDRFRKVVGTIVLLRDPLAITDLASIVEFDEDDVINTLANFHSVIIGASYPDDIPRVYHPSFLDFITNASRCKEKAFLIIPQDHHCRLTLRCLMSMAPLKRNILDITNPSLLNSEIPDFNVRMRKCFSPALQYACRHWASHLVQAEPRAEVLAALKAFLSRLLLGWLEAMSLLGSMSVALESIKSVKDWVTDCARDNELSRPLSDVHRFILEHFDLVKGRALHLYYSALPFTPHANWVYEEYHEETRDTVHVLQGLSSEWSPHMTLGGHSSNVYSVAFSPDGARLASCSNDRAIRIWDPSSGAHIATLEGHSDYINSVAFSPDGLKLASGSSDTTIRIWDSSSGAHLATLEGHCGGVGSVAFSHDGAKLASGSDDTTIHVWDISSGAHLATFEGHSDYVRAVAFFPDGRLASGSDDGTVQIWDIISCVHLATLKGHTSWVNSVALSRDGTNLASASNDRTIRIWDTTSGTHIVTLEGHSYHINSVAFCPDGLKLASGSSDTTIRIWDSSSGVHIATLEGHSAAINSVAFSRDGRLVSGSDDKTVRIWDTTSGARLTTPEGHSLKVNYIAFFCNGKKLVTGSDDKTIRMWDSATGVHLATLEGHSSRVLYIALTRDGARLASGSADCTVCIWDTASGVHLATLEGHWGPVRSITFSRDGAKLASGSNDKTIRIWDTTSGAHLITLQDHSNWARPIAFSHDGANLASVFGDRTIYIWDTISGTCLATLEGRFYSVNSISFSRDGAKIVCHLTLGRSHTWDIPRLITDRHDTTYHHTTDTLSPPTVAGPDESFEPYSYELDNHWLFWKSWGSERRRICYIPQEYSLNEDSFVWHEQCVTIGCLDGRVLILDVSAIDDSPARHA